VLLANKILAIALGHLDEVFGRHIVRRTESDPRSFSSLVVLAALELCWDEGIGTHLAVFAVMDVVLLVAHC
jgi:hypothetical protein